jgi:uncharacterized protein (DUF2164 family)
MSDVQFFQTRMGQQFYDGTMPRLVAAVEQLTKTVEQLLAVVEKQQQKGEQK